MKSIKLLLAMLLTLGLSCGALVGNGFAQSTPGEVAVSADKENVAAIDINTADEQLLTQVNGVGPVMAKRIVDYRRENGNFKSLDELTNVKGIGQKTLAKMKPYLAKI
ncbi:MAG: ComEA family DNA-binding protein [Desulforhopalus sp.]